jgi:hypothetical protein
LNLAQQKYIADQNYELALENAKTLKDREAAEQKYRDELLELEKGKGGGGGGSGGGGDGGGDGGGSGGGSGSSGGRRSGSPGGSPGGGPPGLGPSANLTQEQLSALGYIYQNVRLYDPTKSRPYGEHNMWVKDGETYGDNPYAQEYSGNLGYDPSLMGYTQAGADTGSFVPTDEENKNVWDTATYTPMDDYGGTTNYDDYNYDDSGNPYNSSWSDYA